MECTKTAVPNSDMSDAESITGTTGQDVAVDCDDGYSGSGNVTCQADGTFTALTCTGNNCCFVNVVVRFLQGFQFRAGN